MKETSVPHAHPGISDARATHTEPMLLPMRPDMHPTKPPMPVNLHDMCRSGMCTTNPVAPIPSHHLPLNSSTNLRSTSISWSWSSSNFNRQSPFFIAVTSAR